MAQGTSILGGAFAAAESSEFDRLADPADVLVAAAVLVQTELMKALEQRMDANMKKAGSVEFAQIFDEVGAAR